MIYIFKNFIQFAKKSTMIFVLFVICEITAVLVVLFSFGAFQNYQTQLDVEQTKVNQDFFVISFGNIVGTHNRESGEVQYYDGDGKITLAQFRQFLNILDHETKSSFTGFAFSVGYTDENSISYLIQDDVDNLENMDIEDDDLKDDFFYQSLFPRLEYDEDLKDYGLYNSYLENLSLKEGRYFTQQEIINGENLIVLRPDGNPQLIGQDIIFLGKIYKVIGILSNDMMYEFEVPFKTLDDDLTIESIRVLTDKIITTPAYKEIKNAFFEVVGDYALVPPLETVDINEIRFYNSLILISVALAVISAINLTILFRYVLRTRWRQLAIFQLSGCTKNKARQIYICEIMSLSTLIFLFCAVLYHHLIMPNLSNYILYIKEAYSLKTYLILFSIYTISCYAFLNVMIIINLKKSPVTLLGERLK